jgi:hypothetical protein
MKQIEDSFGVEFTGKMINVVVPKVDMDAIDAFMDKLPSTFEIEVAAN